MLPPGDLRMALAALCGDDEWGDTWARVLQHRFAGRRRDARPRRRQPADRRPLGAARRPRRRRSTGSAGCSAPSGRVLPMALTPIDITAEVRGAGPGRPDGADHGARPGRGRDHRRRHHLDRARAARPGGRAPRRSTAIRAADWVVLGPGSWFTSVIPHLLVPAAARGARRRPTPGVVVVLNLAEQAGETHGFGAGGPPRGAGRARAGPRVHTVLADRDSVGDGLDELRGRGRRRYGAGWSSTTSRAATAPRDTTRRSSRRRTPGSWRAADRRRSTVRG